MYVMYVNLDGKPIYDSATNQFWTILFKIHTMHIFNPIVIGVLNGKQKPAKIKEFHKSFVTEI